MSKLQAKCLANALQKATEEATEFFTPHIDAWLDLQQKLDQLDEEQAAQDFHYDYHNGTSIFFSCGDWEEQGYNGSYHRYGTTIEIPYSFFDDHQPYEAEAQRYLDAKATRAEAEKQRTRIAHVANLENALRKARQEAGL
jgi:hypothetical protein